MRIKLTNPANLQTLVLLLGMTWSVRADDPLPSWNDTAPKKAIVDFVERITKERSPDFVKPEQRIATFDNDGTLWVEQPDYTQVVFAVDRLVAMAPQHPAWRETEPFKSILAHDRVTLQKFTMQDYEKLIAVTHSGMTVPQFQEIVKKWLAEARHRRFKRPYTECVYQPMLELMRYLRSNGFKTYIVTGGGQEFVRAFAGQTYDVPSEQVVGSMSKVKYQYDKEGRPELIRLPEVLLIDDKAGKPEGINMMIGQRPQCAFGNSTGDQQMLEYTGAGDGARLMMLVHHDDAKREYAYGAQSKIGTFSDALMADAKERGWIVVSMKDDWKTIFPHLDAYNLIPFFKGEVRESPRKEFLYCSDDGDLLAIRVNQWKVSFKEQEHTGLDVWKREFTSLRAPNIYNLRSDPFERGTESFECGKWMADRAFLIVPSQAVVGKWLASFKEFPIRQKPASFNLDSVMQQVTVPQSGGD